MELSDMYPSRPTYGDSLLPDILIKEKLLKRDFAASNSFISEYFTPDETLYINKNASKLIFQTPCESPTNDSEINASNSSHNINKKNSFIEKLSKALEFTIPDNMQHKYSLNQKVSGATFIDIGKKVHSSQFLDRQTDTILISSDEEDHDGILESLNEADDSLVCDYSTIVISDDESYTEHIHTNDIKDESLSEAKESHCSLHEIEHFTSSNSDILNDQLFDNLANDKEFDTPLVEISAKLQDNYMNINNVTGIVLEEVSADNTYNSEKDVPETPVVLNNDNLNQKTSELTTRSSEFKFNDTLEEIEMFLQNGENYTISEETDNSLNYNMEGLDICKTNTNIPVFDLASNVNESSNERTKKSFIPIKNNLGRPNLSRVNASPKPTMKQNSEFKIPFQVEMPHKITRFKNILSPVSVYVKNSPKTPQIQHTSIKPLSKGNLCLSRSSKKANKENDDDSLPSRIYKPAKQSYMLKKHEQKLPKNIQRHVPNIPVIVKHQGRLQENSLDIINIDDKLENTEENLTACFDSSISSNSLIQDMSLLMSKNAYIE